jgi:hypothetical protein
MLGVCMDPVIAQVMMILFERIIVKLTSRLLMSA